MARSRVFVERLIGNRVETSIESRDLDDVRHAPSGGSRAVALGGINAGGVCARERLRDQVFEVGRSPV
jgi:hypothetical protein